jgi:hypothetical protein
MNSEKNGEVGPVLDPTNELAFAFFFCSFHALRFGPLHGLVAWEKRQKIDLCCREQEGCRGWAGDCNVFGLSFC